VGHGGRAAGQAERSCIHDFVSEAEWIRGDLETDTLRNSSSSTRDGKELWIYQAVEARDYRFVGRSRGTDR
jgi:hypothetical protein